MKRARELLLGVAALAAILALGKYGMDRQRAADALRGHTVYDALRAEEARKRVIGAPGSAGGTPPALRGAAGRGPLDPLPVRFVEVDPASLGIDFVHTFGGGLFDDLLKTSGGGLAAFDGDGDGDTDLYFVQGAQRAAFRPGETPPPPPRNRYYRNEGGGRFVDATDAVGLGDEGYGLGATVGDYDGDGDPDVFVSNFGPSRLYRNDDGRFTDVTAAAGIRVDGFTVGAAWGDADGDGILDLLACGYVQFDPSVRPRPPDERIPGPLAYRGETCRLLLGSADGTFRDVTREAGLWSTAGRGMGVAFVDLTASGARPHLLVANDATDNFAYERRAGGTYVETGLPLGFALSDLAQARSSMGIAVADFDRDGLPDAVVPDGSGGAFYVNVGGRFEERAGPAGLDGAMEGRTGWGAVPLDYDRDGFTDLFLTCGALHAQEPQRPLMLRNVGGGRFEDVSASLLPGRALMGRGAVPIDLDGDGDPDLVCNNLGARPVILRNDGGDARAALRVRCVGGGRNRDGIGALVEVDGDGLVQVEEVRTTQGYLSSTDPVLEFGLGRAKAARRVRVRFPSGAVREAADVPAGSIAVHE